MKTGLKIVMDQQIRGVNVVSVANETQTCEMYIFLAVSCNSLLARVRARVCINKMVDAHRFDDDISSF